MILNAFISHVEDVEDYIKDTWKKAFISHTKCRRRRRWKENHIQYMKDVEDVEDYIKDTWKKAFISHTKMSKTSKMEGKPHTIHERRWQWLLFLIRSRSESNSKS